MKETPILPGHYVNINDRIIARCVECCKLVWANKPFLGPTHFCLSKADIALKRWLRVRQRAIEASVDARERAYEKARGGITR